MLEFPRTTESGSQVFLVFRVFGVERIEGLGGRGSMRHKTKGRAIVGGLERRKFANQGGGRVRGRGAARLTRRGPPEGNKRTNNG